MTTTSSRHREPSTSSMPSQKTCSFDLCGPRAPSIASTANEDSVGSLSFLPEIQRQSSSTTATTMATAATGSAAAAPFVVQTTRLSVVPSTSCRALTFNEVRKPFPVSIRVSFFGGVRIVENVAYLHRLLFT